MPPRKKRSAKRPSSKKFSRPSKSGFKKKPYHVPPTPWNWEAGVTQSLITRFVDCPEQTYLGYVEGWSSRRLKHGLEFGNIWHLIQEHQYDKAGEAPASVARRVCKAFHAVRSKTCFKNELESLQELLGIAEAMFPLYCDTWKENDDEIEWIEREQKFAVSYTFRQVDGTRREVMLRGMLDGAFRDEGGLGVFETKTKSQISTDSIRDQLKSDMQTLFYTLASELVTGEQPTQVLYNVVRRPGLKKRQGDTLNDYISRVQEDVASRPQHYFMRWHVDLLDSDLDNFRQYTLDPILAHFAQWSDALKKSEGNRWDSPHHYLNSNALVGKYGKCDLWDLMVRKSKAGFHKRSLCFPELDESGQAA